VVKRLAKWAAAAVAAGLAVLLAWALVTGRLAGAVGSGPSGSAPVSSAPKSPKPSATDAGAAPESYPGKVLWVVDGDTLHVEVAGEDWSVRLLGVDAPEVAHGSTAADCGGDDATAGLARLAAPGTAVTLSFDSRADKQDRYDRYLAYISTAETDDVALRLIADGLVAAWIPSGEPKPDRWADYQAAMDAARTSQAGSWATCETLGR
jgi:endonuclease YncB( thermonuclease family)